MFCVCGVTFLYVSVARLRTSRFYTHSKDVVETVNHIHSTQHVVAEAVLVYYSMVGGYYHHTSTLVTMVYAVCCPRHTRCCITVDGFAKHVLLWQLGQLFYNVVSIFVVSAYVDVLQWYEVSYSVESLLK